jgi:hypothetical protein
MDPVPLNDTTAEDSLKKLCGGVWDAARKWKLFLTSTLHSSRIKKTLNAFESLTHCNLALGVFFQPSTTKETSFFAVMRAKC